jgi:hypothetical protein
MKLLIVTVTLALTAYAKKIPLELDGVACKTPPPQHCPDVNCPGPLVILGGALTRLSETI